LSAVAAPEAVRAPGQGRVFLAVLQRDIYVTWGEFPVFLAQVILQPFFLLFVFGKVLGSLGYTTPGYSDLLFPGLLALTAVITSMQTLAFPLVIEFGWTKEIEDRLLAPMSTTLVAAEKVLFAMIRALIATAVMIPIGILVLGSIPWRWAGFPLFLAIAILGSMLGASMGLVLGTLVKPNRINIVFALVFTPLLFTGCSQYPWPSLSKLPYFQVITACNPMTYVSEGMRGALVPEVPHIAPWICLLVLPSALIVLLAIGTRGFFRRAID
jgi:ABC-2 type transport system permease protein